MKMPDLVRKAIRDAKIAYVASADLRGRPHLAVSKLIRVLDPEHVTFTGWFCPQTSENVMRNPSVTIAFWDPITDHGYQLVGTVVGSAVTAVINGLDQKGSDYSAIPQEERKLTVLVEGILEVKSGVHSDESL